MIKTNEKGITLIALVVTIIVLLLLAGVSLQALTGKNGILSKAKEAKERAEMQDYKEEIELELMDCYGENGFDLNMFKERLQNKYGLSEDDIEDTENGCKFKLDKYKVTVKIENGKADVKVELDENVEDTSVDLSKIDITLDYTPKDVLTNKVSVTISTTDGKRR